MEGRVNLSLAQSPHLTSPSHERGEHGAYYSISQPNAFPAFPAGFQGVPARRPGPFPCPSKRAGPPPVGGPVLYHDSPLSHFLTQKRDPHWGIDPMRIRRFPGLVVVHGLGVLRGMVCAVDAPPLTPPQRFCLRSRGGQAAAGLAWPGPCAVPGPFQTAD
jgi:hypothetical protein